MIPAESSCSFSDSEGCHVLSRHSLEKSVPFGKVHACGELKMQLFVFLWLGLRELNYTRFNRKAIAKRPNKNLWDPNLFSCGWDLGSSTSPDSTEKLLQRGPIKISGIQMMPRLLA